MSVSVFRQGNIFDSNCQTLVNTINCVGVMGKGLAKEMASRYPEMLQIYKDYCNKGFIKPGILWLWRGSERWILNFPTKFNWMNPSRYEWIEMGLQKFVDTYKSKGITSIAFPMLGCTNGKLNKDKVLQLMLKYFNDIEDCEIEIYFV